MQDFSDVLINDYVDKEAEPQELNEWITPELFSSINPGDIIIAKIYQQGSPEHSARPVLVVNKSENEVYGFFITSSNENENMDFYKIPITELGGTGLNRACYVNLSREVHVKPQYISGPKPVAGHIATVDLNKIIEHLTDIYYVRSYPFKYNLKLAISNMKKIK